MSSRISAKQSHNSLLIREILLISDGADNCSNEFKDIASVINKNSIHLKSAFLFLNERDKKKITTLKSVRKRKSFRMGRIISYEEITRTLEPEKSRIASVNKPSPKRVFKRAYLKENQSLKPKYPFMANVTSKRVK
ncbi:MAG: hypothetical protein IEMM0008_1892 [bacterium]|nr:MAG: hypothetical protein IEMM0008_1892 [bacterium]